jgi:superfamily II DNA or RNA helicase
MITFKKKNDVYLEFEGDKADLRMLSDYFTFKVPGAEFTPQFRNKFWDGKIRLANLRESTIYAGLTSDITKFAKDMDVECYFEGSEYNFPGREQVIEDKILDDFLGALKLPFEIRDYQYDAIRIGIEKQRALILSPTASGKSLIVYCLMRWWREIHDRKILIIVPTISLVGQLISDFHNYSNGSFNDVAGITAGADKEPEARVVVSTWQSIHKLPASWFAKFGSVVVDEVHHAQSKSIQAIMNKMLICPDRIGLTGTLQDTKTHELVLKGLFGSVTKLISTKELMERDQVSQMDIRLLQLNYSDEDRKKVKDMTYNDEVEFIVTHEKRNKLVAKMAATLPGNTLVVFLRLEHGKDIYEYINTEKKLYYVAGETDKDSREAVRQMAESDDVVIVASLGVFSTGVNIRNLHNLIFAHPTKSKIKVLQSIGRVLRKSDNGQKATVFDIIDDLKYKSRDNFALRHSNERFKYYTLEGFDYKINTINL